QTRVVWVGTHPMSITLDGAGHAWVGGDSFAVKLDISSMTVIENHSVQGQVTALAFSAGQNQLVTVIDPGSTGGVSARAYRADQQFGAAYSDSNSAAVTQYAAAPLSSELLRPAQLGTGALVSDTVNNAIAVSASGSRFSVIDLSTGQVILTASFEAPIR